MAEVDHHRLSKRDLREPDEFQVLTGRATTWAAKHQNLLIGVGAVSVAIVALVAGFSWNASRNTQAATTRLAAAQALIADRKYADAATEFDALARAYPRTSAGRLAILYRAHALLSQGNHSEASTAYGEYLAAGPPTDYLRQAALLGLASAHERAADMIRAEDAYREATKVPGPYLAYARIGLAALLDRSGKSDAATSMLTEILASPDLDPDTRAVVTARLGTRKPGTP